ncbi:MAG: hypothetical protein OEY55_04230 [Acidimicrobiia bacterium]|nr:hypothetical protein [Acidimicrobiia bacterium]MDH5420995.1 hypothetical protein [Acidimicrobiia bacterium]MDH5504318.1 hypothetical protein [Acidimicrobiia bacterium]
MARSKSPVVLLVRLVLLVAVGLGLFIVLAPLAPDGSWLEDAGLSLRDIMSAWWGQPIR